MSRLIQDLQLERRALSGLLNNKDLFVQCSNIISPDLFTDEDGINRTIFNVIKQFFIEKRDFDAVLVTSVVNSYGINFKIAGYENVEEYIKTLKSVKVSESTSIDALNGLYNIKVANILKGNAVEAFNYVDKNFLKIPTKDLIDNTVSTFSGIHKLYGTDDEPEDITGHIYDLIKDRLENPQEEIGMKTPFNLFNRLFGGLRDGEVYAFVARPKHGKTTWLAYFAAEVAKLNNIKCLYLDTEMKTEDIKFRMLSSYSGIKMWNLETGNVTPEEREHLRKSASDFKKSLESRFYHKYCVNMTTDQVISLIKRWIMRNIKTDEKFLIVYDYIKMTGEKTSDHNKEYQILGEKVNALKELAGTYKFPLLTACQLNRDAERGNDDSSAIAASDRLQWFASFVAILRRKREEEIEMYGDNIGSHSLIPLATRFQGKEAMGHTFKTIMPLLEDSNKKRRYKAVNFFINYDIDNFSVKELNTSDDIAKALKNEFHINAAENSKEDADF